MLDLGRLDYRVDRLACMYCVCRGFTELLQREIVTEKPRIDRLLLRFGECNLFCLGLLYGDNA